MGETTNIGRLEAIWIKPARKGPMREASEARLIAGDGIAGNADRGERRQVTIIEQEVFDRLSDELSRDVRPGMRRANLLVSGIRLRESGGAVLRVGACRVMLQGETIPCGRMDDAHPGLRDALARDWGGGAYGSVLDDGVIRVGDPVALESAPSEAESS